MSIWKLGVLLRTSNEWKQGKDANSDCCKRGGDETGFVNDGSIAAPMWWAAMQTRGLVDVLTAPRRWRRWWGLFTVANSLQRETHCGQCGSHGFRGASLFRARGRTNALRPARLPEQHQSSPDDGRSKTVGWESKGALETRSSGADGTVPTGG